MQRKILKREALFTVFVLLFFSSMVSAGNIDPSSDGHKYAYGENIGWSNFTPSEGPGVTVKDNKLEGFIWAENIGWIKLNPENSGVTHVGDGKLSGYAWGENVGWINFSCITNGTCDSGVDYGVTINLMTGVFEGDAWGENIGWIKFNYEGFDENHVLTSWRMNGDVNSSGTVTLEDAVMTLQVGADIIPASPVHSGADVNEDNRVGLEEAGYILQRVSEIRTE